MLIRKLDISGCHKEVSDIGVQALSELPVLQDLNISYLRKVSHNIIPLFSIHGKLSILL